MPVRTGQGLVVVAPASREGRSLSDRHGPARTAVGRTDFTGVSPVLDKQAFQSASESETQKGMDRFVSTFTNKIDAKGRVSIPAPFRAVLERDGYSSGGIYCYPSLDAPALDAGGERLAKKIDGLLAGLPDYSDERDGALCRALRRRPGSRHRWGRPHRHS